MGHLCDELAIQSLGLIQHVYRADPLTEVFAVGRASGGPIATAAPHLAKMSDAVIYDFSLAS